MSAIISLCGLYRHRLEWSHDRVELRLRVAYDQGRMPTEPLMLEGQRS